MRYKIGFCEVTAKISVSELSFGRSSEVRLVGLQVNRQASSSRSTYFGLSCINVVDSRPSSVRRARESSLKARIDRTACV